MVLLGLYRLCCHHSHVWLTMQSAAGFIYPSRISERCRHVSITPNVHRTRTRSRKLPMNQDIHGIRINAGSRRAVAALLMPSASGSASQSLAATVSALNADTDDFQLGIPVHSLLLCAVHRCSHAVSQPMFPQCIISPKGLADPGGFARTADAKFGTWDGGFSMPQPPAIASRNSY